MGWWTQDADGHSFAGTNDKVNMVWGDEPADAIDAALDQIEKAFERSFERKPTKAEVTAGLKFSLSVRDEFPDEVNPDA